MPTIAHCQLPAYSALRTEGSPVDDEVNGQVQLHIGLLNLMPDAAFEATERQWIRLCANYHEAATYVYPFTFNVDDRSVALQEHISRFYELHSAMSQRALDLLIVTGANPKTTEITHETFWQPMIDTIHWAKTRRCPVVCSCLATHAVVKEFYGIDRVRLPRKSWGVYSHECLGPGHPLIQDVDSDWRGPHSHYFGVTRQQLESVGIEVLVDGEDAGVYLAVSDNYPEFVFLQGHPEYDANSLLKEFKREVYRFVAGDVAEFPGLPENYLTLEDTEIISQFRDELVHAMSSAKSLPSFPEQRLQAGLSCSWRAAGLRLFDNLLREVHHAK